MKATWKDIKRLTGQNANVWKYVFDAGDAVAESVLYRYPDFQTRTVICCSTQSGCPVGCRFCGAGDHFVRNLTSEEIVSQPVHLMSDHWIDPRQVERLQIMFMSMGEPLLNLQNLIPALRQLHEMYPKAALLISTIGPYLTEAQQLALFDISKSIPTIGLQFSVHEATDEARDRLIPLRGKMNLWEISDSGADWHEYTGRRPFFNYCAHGGNTSDADATSLTEHFDPDIWNATVSVICERGELMAAANERQRKLASDFAGKLIERGFDVRVFDPAGQDDIGGGCGQLWYVQEWMRNHPEAAKRSTGYGLPVIHAPQ